MSGNTVVCLQTQLGPIIHRGQLCVDSIYTPSDMNFQAILMPKVILAKFTHLEHSYLKYALVN